MDEHAKTCRCEQCRANRAVYERERRRERALALAENPDLAPHGTESTYNNWGCHCASCRAAHAEKMKERRG